MEEYNLGDKVYFCPEGGKGTYGTDVYIGEICEIITTTSSVRYRIDCPDPDVGIGMKMVPIRLGVLYSDDVLMSHSLQDLKNKILKRLESVYLRIVKTVKEYKDES